MLIAKPNGTPNTDIINAISRLNAWLRSKADWRALNAGIRRAIYYYKSHALSALAGAGRVEARPVAIKVTCRDCNGTGSYVDSWGGRYDHCHRCGNSGEVELQFIESDVLPDGPTWHTPRFKAPGNLSMLIGDWDEPGLPGDGWTVNRPGHDNAPPVALTPSLPSTALAAFTACATNAGTGAVTTSATRPRRVCISAWDVE